MVPMLRFLYRCCRRLEKLGFTYESPVYKAVDKAYDGLDRKSVV